MLKEPSLEVTSTESTSLRSGLMAHTCPSLGTDLKAWTLGRDPVQVLQSLQTAEGVCSLENLPSLFNQRNSLEIKPSKILTSQPSLALPRLSYHLDGVCETSRVEQARADLERARIFRIFSAFRYRACSSSRLGGSSGSSSTYRSGMETFSGLDSWGEDRVVEWRITSDALI